MRGRRIRFAAPFVIVTTASCGQPAPTTLPTESPVLAASSVDASVVDTIPPIDAPPVHAAIWVTIAMPAHTVPPPKDWACRGTGPQRTTCNPPRPSHYRAFEVTSPILEMQANGAGSIVVIAQKQDDETGNGLLTRGAVVTAQTMSMNARAKVGSVVDATPTSVTLELDLPIDDVKNGADLVIEGTYAATGSEDEAVRPVEGRIIAIERSDIFTIVTVGRGSSDGVDRGWRVEVIDDKNRPVRNGLGTVFKATSHACYAKLKLTPDEVKRYPRVRLSPPGE